MLSGYTRYIPNVKVTCITMSRLHWYLCCGLNGCSILQQKFNDLDSVLLAGNMKWGESILKQQTPVLIWSAHFNVLSSLKTFQVDNKSYLITLTQLQLRSSIKIHRKFIQFIFAISLMFNHFHSHCQRYTWYGYDAVTCHMTLYSPGPWSSGHTSCPVGV